MEPDSIENVSRGEHEMILTGASRYGEYFTNAFKLNSLLNNFIKSVDQPDRFIFFAFYSQIRKHHTLALLSALRLHHIQSGMNLRQVIEAGQWAAFALGNTEEDKFFEKDSKGIAETKDKHKQDMYQWLNQNFSIKATEMKNLKNLISGSVAHANLYYAFQNFGMGPVNQPGFKMGFFDEEDDYLVKTDLWFIANTAIGLIDLFCITNQQYKIFRLIDGFDKKFGGLIEQNNRLKKEMESHPRYLEAQKIKGV